LFHGGWLDVKISALLAERIPEPIGPVFLGNSFFHKPTPEVFEVISDNLSESAEISDLSTVVLDGTSLPSVLLPGLLWHIQLGCNIPNTFTRDFPGDIRESTLLLEKLQEDSEPKTGRSGLVAKQCQFIWEQKPD
jgi:hypothetical protein